MPASNELHATNDKNYFSSPESGISSCRAGVDRATRMVSPPDGHDEASSATSPPTTRPVHASTTSRAPLQVVVPDQHDEGVSPHSPATPQQQLPRLELPSEHSVEYYDDSDDDDDHEEDEDETMEIHGLVGQRYNNNNHSRTPNHSMSIASGFSDDEGGGNGSIHGIASSLWRNTSIDHYEYDYIDNDELRGGHVGLCCGGVKVPRLAICLITAFLVASLLAIFLPDQPQELENQPPVVHKYKGAPQYTCPLPPDASDGPDDSTVFTSSMSERMTIPKYQNNSDFMLDLVFNLSTFTETFRDLEFRDWGKTYAEVKDSLVHWKEDHYLPNLKTGDSVFESGCGIGLGLYLTMEILQEQNKNLRDLHLYGSDFGRTPVLAGNVVLDKILLSDESVGGGKRGLLCAADSTNLNFIPTGTFDLVFSSRIAPLPDPYQFLESGGAATTLTTSSSESPANMTLAELVLEHRREVCATLTTDWKSAALQQAALERQYDWYGRWVAEMVRVAKPGAAVIVEQVGDPYCDEHHVDAWGIGVPYSFWNDAVEIYKWDVDPESVEFGVDALYPTEHRYHVFLRKLSR